MLEMWKNLFIYYYVPVTLVENCGARAQVFSYMKVFGLLLIVLAMLRSLGAVSLYKERAAPSSQATASCIIPAL